MSALNRRSLLQVAGFASIAVTCSIPAAAAPASSSWDKAVAAHAAARDAYRRFYDQVITPAYQRAEAVAPRPPMQFSITARNGQAETYSLPANDLHRWDGEVNPNVREAAAEQRRLWLAYQSAMAAENADALETEYERLIDVETDLWRAVMLMPAPHLAAVAWKLDNLFGPNNRNEPGYTPSWDVMFTDALTADVKRLGGLA